MRKNQFPTIRTIINTSQVKTLLPAVPILSAMFPAHTAHAAGRLSFLAFPAAGAPTGETRAFFFWLAFGIINLTICVIAIYGLIQYHRVKTTVKRERQQYEKMWEEVEKKKEIKPEEDEDDDF